MRIRICILLEKNIGPPTEAMLHGGCFSWTLNPQVSIEILSLLNA